MSKKSLKKTKVKIENITTYIVILIFLLGVGGFFYDDYKIKKQSEAQIVSNGDAVKLNKAFRLEKNNFVRIENTNIEIAITGFYNQPCPENLMCISSGQDIYYGYKINGYVPGFMFNLTPFGYQPYIIESDYNSYAILKIYRSNQAIF